MDPTRFFQPEDWLRFVQGTTFGRKWGAFGLSDDDLRALEILIMLGPKQPPAVPGVNGMRKVRFNDPRSGRGKSGGFRIYYAYFEAYGVVFLATVFGKNEQSDLSAADKSALADLVRQIETVLEEEEV